VDWEHVRAAILELDGRKPDTIRTYKRLWSAFDEWCIQREFSPLPASIETAALYLCHVAPLFKLNSLNNILSAISYVHRLNGFSFNRNFLKPILKGIGRAHGGAIRKKPAIQVDYLRTIVGYFPRNKRGLRDRAIFMTGSCGGLRSEELAHMDYLTFAEDGIGLLRIDRDGASIEMRYRGNALTRARKVLKYIPRYSEFCPVKALEEWITEARIARGPLFRAIDKHGNVGETRLTRNYMPVLLRRALRDAEVARGRSPVEAAEIARPYTFHSLRIGFVKSAVEAGVRPERIAMHLGLTTAQCIEQYRRRYTNYSGQSAVGRHGWSRARL
jgi:integrase